MTAEIRDRRLTPVLQDLLADEPVLALHGPRSVGKSTLLQGLAQGAGSEVIDLDDPQTRAAVAEDPALYVSGPESVCIDEFQHVPEVLDSIKATLNTDLRPGRFILTGSTRFDSLPQQSQSLTGRLHRVDVLPLSQGEIDGVKESFIEQLMTDPSGLVDASPATTSREEYVARVTRGGMPLAVARRSDTARDRWFANYVDLVLERDVLELAKVRQRAKMATLLRRLASQTGQVLNLSSAAQDAGLEPSTAENYLRLLEAVFLVRRIPAWGTTLKGRVAKSPKVHILDSGVGCYLADLNADKLGAKSPQALAEFGHQLESFCVGEVIKQLSWMDARITFGHYRTRDGAEVDLILEDRSGRVVALEVKASGRVRGDDFAALAQLREQLGASFLGGVILYLGSRSFSYDDRLAARPVDRLWH